MAHEEDLGLGIFDLPPIDEEVAHHESLGAIYEKSGHDAREGYIDDHFEQHSEELWYVPSQVTVFTGFQQAAAGENGPEAYVHRGIYNLTRWGALISVDAEVEAVSSRIQGRAIIQASARVAASAVVAKDAVVCEAAILDDEARVGMAAVVGPAAYLGRAASLYMASSIDRAVTIGDRSSVGEHSRVDAFAVVGQESHIGDTKASHFAKDRSYAKVHRDLPLSQIKGVHIQEHVQIGNKTTVGNSSQIGEGASIGDKIKMGEDVIVMPGAVVYDKQKIPAHGRVVMSERPVVNNEPRHVSSRRRKISGKRWPLAAPKQPESASAQPAATPVPVKPVAPVEPVNQEASSVSLSKR
ncbi:MAG: hypothetical protein JWN38_657 [Candidatus Saccharibacteria bacterium]|nr:hypothetical protein [Candidatus Saccharibacteria bacterium]